MLNHADIGRAVRSLRIQRKLTIEQLAEAASIDRGNLSRMERGINGWTIETLSQVAQALVVSVTELVALAEHPGHTTTILAILALPESQRARLLDFLAHIP